ncbi:MAG: tail fiber domain-containing protein, partial [Candidatus Poseidoniaceae archaeon]|nr:tail fiber domain-containing protein [Candidatus Poseidoniaceae archaeon]
MTDKSSGTGVDFNFTIPPGATGASGTSGLDANGDLNLSWSDSRRIIMNYDNSYRQGFHLDASSRTLKMFSTTNDSGGAIAFYTRGGAGSSDTDYGTERMRILNNGNVGIGTTSPSYKLDVQGTGNFTGKLSLPTGASYLPGLQLGTQTTYADDQLYSLRWGGSTLMGMGLHSSTRGTFGKQGLAIHIPNTEEYSVKTNGWADIFSLDGATKKAYFGGNVGIKTTNPRETLDITGTLRVGSGDGMLTISSRSSTYGSETVGLQTTIDGRTLSDGSPGTYGGEYRNVLALQPDGGRVGINQSSPDRTLDVNGTCDIANMLRVYGGLQLYGTELSYYNYAQPDNDYFTNGGSIQNDSPTLNFGLYVQYTIRAQGIVVLGDQRIKSNVVDINDTTALEQVRQLKPKYYEYKDKVKRGSSSVIGFIAQEVKEVLPRAVSVGDGEIPNIYEIATISSSNTVTFTNFNTSNLEGTNCTLIGYLAEDERKEITITEVVDEHTVLVEENMSEWGAEVFVWGQKVDDFHHLNKDYIFTVTTTAVQEIDRQLQAERSRNDSLE